VAEGALSGRGQRSCISPLQTILRLFGTLCFGQVVCVINSISAFTTFIVPATVPRASGQRLHKHRSTEYSKSNKNLPPSPKQNPPTKQQKTPNHKSLFSSFGQQLEASLNRVRKESKWGREISLHDQITTGTVLQTFHYLDQLSLPDHLCASPFLFVLLLCLLSYVVMPFRFARQLKCRRSSLPECPKLSVTANMTSRGTKDTETC